MLKQLAFLLMSNKKAKEIATSLNEMGLFNINGAPHTTTSINAILRSFRKPEKYKSRAALLIASSNLTEMEMLALTSSKAKYKQAIYLDRA